MSRALDKDLKYSLSGGDTESAYKAISTALLPSAAYELREIAILPKSHSLQPGTYFLESGHAIGVSKSALIQAFFVARRILQRHKEGTEFPTGQDLFAATAVVLLLDPEHLTAANTRKRLIRSVLVDHAAALRKLKEERQLVDSFLTSHLVRHTKSPTLWSHRRWLLGLSVQLGQAVDVAEDISSIVMVAGDRHPRNYYSWDHARWLIRSSLTEAATTGLVEDVKRWCFGHHTDISGWSFLHYLLVAVASGDATTPCAVFDETLKRAASLHLTSESIWVFLRTLAASALVGDDQRFEFEELGCSLLGVSKDSSGQDVIERSIRWYKTVRTAS